MAEGDQILIQSIKNLFSNEEFDQVLRLSDFSTDFVLQATAKILNVIFHPEKPFENEKPPQSMSARYKFGSKLAELCLELGFHGQQDLGYQTFMYSNENDLRTVFMFLIDKLPKETEQLLDQNLSNSELKKQQIQKSLSETKPENPSTSPFDAWAVEKMTDEELFRLLPKETRAAALDAKIKLCSLIQENEELKVGKDDDDDNSSTSTSDNIKMEPTETKIKISNDENDVIMDEILATSVDMVPDSAEILQKGTEDIQKDEETINQKPMVPGQESKIQALKSKKENAEKDLEILYKEYKTSMKTLKQQKQNILAHGKEYQELLELKKEKDENLNQRLKVMELLPAGEENIEKLKAIIAKKKAKIMGLQDQWEAHKESLMEDREKMKKDIEKLKSNRPDEDSTTSSLKNQIKSIENQLTHQNQLAMKLKKQVENTSKKEYLPRSDYTQQIMDILNNVTKQKNETTKVIEEIRFIQKDINSLEGKLSRTYADADHILFEQAKKDKALVPGYKLLVEIHKTNDAIIETVRETGRLKRTTKALQESAAAEKAKNVDEKVVKLQSDLAKLKKEVYSSQKK